MEGVMNKEELSAQWEQEIVDAIKKLPLEERLQLIALNNYLLRRKQAEKDQERKSSEVVIRSNKRQAPVLQALNEIVAGKRAPTEEEIKYAREHLTPEETAKISTSLTAEQIPEYWLKVITSCEKIKHEVFEYDHTLLKHVTMIEYVPEEQGDHFAIKFYFSSNEYIENETLSVRFVMFTEDQPEKTEGTEIKWKEGKDFTKQSVTQKQKNKKTGKTRDVTKTVSVDSFFNFFKTVEIAQPNAEDDDEEEIDPEEQGIESLNISYGIARVFQEEIIPFHFEYYLGTRTGDEDEDEGFGDFGEEDDEDDMDEDDDDEDEEEAPQRRGGKGGKFGKGGRGGKGGKGNKQGGAARGGQKQECKQQ